MTNMVANVPEHYLETTGETRMAAKTETSQISEDGFICSESRTSRTTMKPSASLSGLSNDLVQAVRLLPRTR